MIVSTSRVVNYLLLPCMKNQVSPLLLRNGLISMFFSQNVYFCLLYS